MSFSNNLLFNSSKVSFQSILPAQHPIDPPRVLFAFRASVTSYDLAKSGRPWPTHNSLDTVERNCQGSHLSRLIILTNYRDFNNGKRR